MYLPCFLSIFASGFKKKIALKKILDCLPLSLKVPSWKLSAIPVALLFISFIVIIACEGPLAVTDLSPYILLVTAFAGVVLAAFTGSLSRRGMAIGLRRSASQILPAIPMLILIAALATTWMLSGVVPTLVDYGLRMLNPTWFLATTCLVCAMVSVLTGSSWSTIATIGVAFIGIGSALGYHPGWTAGAIISGAYFGDKVSPLSDTTVIASSTCGVDLFAHIKYMTITTLPAMLVALVIFSVKGLFTELPPLDRSVDMLAGLRQYFNITPWSLAIPLATLLLIAMRVSTLVTLFISALLGMAGTFIFQPHLGIGALEMLSTVFGGFSPATGSDAVDSFMSTGGIIGIIPVVFLVLSALMFGWVMIGTGMLASLTDAFTRRIRRAPAAVGATIATGLVLNSCTADQYLSIIVNGNMYRSLYRRIHLEQRLLSRTLEDSVSVTSPMIPWSSCGVTQATVLGVPTIEYLPYCIFNYLTPVVSMIVISLGFKVRYTVLNTVRAK